MSAALRVSGLRKRYGRRGPWALDGLSFEVPRGSICGLIGPNGAGKTTLFSVVCGFLPADEGEVDLLGEGPFDPWRFKGRVGVLPQDAALNDRSTPRGFLHHMALLQGEGEASARRAAAEALESVLLSGRGDELVGRLSHGMRRRLATASALLGHPELVLLDEPTAGLDPGQARALRGQLLARRGDTTLLVSSHNLDELERICDHVVFVREGRCVRQGSLEALTSGAAELRWSLSGAPPLAALQAALPGHSLSWEPTLRPEPQGEAGALVQRAPSAQDINASSQVVMRLLAEAGVGLRELKRGRSLEESFLADE